MDTKPLIIIEKSNRKDKRYKATMKNFDMKTHSHHFGGKDSKTFVDNRTEKERDAWIARHKGDKNYDNKHSGIFYSRHLLWGKNKSLEKNIKDLEKLLKVKIKLL